MAKSKKQKKKEKTLKKRAERPDILNVRKDMPPGTKVIKDKKKEQSKKKCRNKTDYKK